MVVGAQGGPAGGSSSLWPGHTSLEGRGVPPNRWSVLKEGLRGAATPYGPNTQDLGGRGVLPNRWSALKECLRGAAAPYGRCIPSGGDAKSCLGGGRRSKRACREQQLPMAGAQ